MVVAIMRRYSIRRMQIEGFGPGSCSPQARAHPRVTLV
jgi:hypothetical protein